MFLLVPNVVVVLNDVVVFALVLNAVLNEVVVDLDVAVADVVAVLKVVVVDLLVDKLVSVARDVAVARVVAVALVVLYMAFQTVANVPPLLTTMKFT